MDNRRLFPLLIFCFSLIMLWDAWQKQSLPKPPTAATAAGATASAGAAPTGAVPAPTPDGASAAVASDGIVKHGDAPTLKVKTDLYLAEISTQGGDLIRLELLRHPDSEDKTKNFVLFDNGGKHLYLGQSGVTGQGMPNHKAIWRTVKPATDYTLGDGAKQLDVALEATSAAGEKVVKTYVFHRDSYQIELRHEGLKAGSHAYYQITRDGKPAEGSGNSMMMGVSTFTGPAVFTQAEKYQKVEFADILKNKAKFAAKADNGWIAMVQHYFVAAWLGPEGVAREFYMRRVGDDIYSSGIILPTAADGRSTITLYAGPQEQSKLEKIAPGLDLVVDYGMLTVIAAPLFWVLATIHTLLGNWGWAIIGLTVLLKLIFFPLSAASYRSMAKMRVMTPKLQRLKELYGDDKMRLNQEMMELYKKEKVNPLGGCLPVLVQIPVFIALYWVLLGTVEMRNAPWLGWIADLSVKDPYYVLPLIMGATMLIQTRLNPTPPDPIQAKVMLFMPILFTGMFLFFPAGLVLYWTVNNVLSIAQQWQITRLIESGESK